MPPKRAKNNAQSNDNCSTNTNSNGGHSSSKLEKRKPLLAGTASDAMGDGSGVDQNVKEEGDVAEGEVEGEDEDVMGAIAIDSASSSSSSASSSSSSPSQIDTSSGHPTKHSSSSNSSSSLSSSSSSCISSVPPYLPIVSSLDHVAIRTTVLHVLVYIEKMFQAAHKLQLAWDTASGTTTTPPEPGEAGVNSPSRPLLPAIHPLAVEWLFVLMLILEKPIDDDIASSFRALYRWCGRLRAECVDGLPRKPVSRYAGWLAALDPSVKAAAAAAPTEASSVALFGKAEHGAMGDANRDMEEVVGGKNGKEEEQMKVKKGDEVALAKAKLLALLHSDEEEDMDADSTDAAAVTAAVEEKNAASAVDAELLQRAREAMAWEEEALSSVQVVQQCNVLMCVIDGRFNQGVK